MRKKTLLWQLFPVNLLITLGALLIVAWYASTTIRNIYFDQMRDSLESKANLIAFQIADLVPLPAADLQQFCQQAGKRARTRITVVTPEGKVLADSSEDPATMSNHSTRPELLTALTGTRGSSVRFSQTLGETMLYVAIPLSADNGSPIGALRLSVSITSIDKVLHAIYIKFFIGSIIVVFLAGTVTLFLSRKIMRPLEEMKRGAERLARGDTENLLPVDTGSMSSEMFALTKSFNHMAKQIRERINTITLQHNELKTVFASMAEMVLAIDTDKRILRLNRSAAELFDLTPKDAKGKMLHEVIHTEDLHKIIDGVLEKGNSVERDIILLVGSVRIYLQIRAVPLVDEHKRPIGILVVLNDMTRLHKLENLRRDFVANVSHELKTPVTSIQGYVETLLDGAIDEHDTAKDFLGIVARQTSRLDAIIDDLLMLSRIELDTDSDNISRMQVNVREVLDSAVLTCQSKAADRNILFKIDCDDNLFAKINPNLIEQAVINLLANAITYSPEHSRVSVNATLQDHDGLQKRLLIKVEDEGIGIEKEHLERLFERFYRTDKARSSVHGGTGLGLSIVKHIAAAHNGSVTVTSEPGKGSAFTLIIPQSN